MKIKAIQFANDGFMTQAFAFGGENKADGSADVKYPSSLQNYLIDTGNEVILVDTGFRPDAKYAPRNEKAQIYVGQPTQPYIEGFKALGYSPEQVTKILVTHKHPDHTDELASFPNAKIYIGPEDADAMKLTGDNVIRATYSDGAYHNFPQSQKVAEGVYFIKARGHTNGNSIVIVEDNGIFYMIHGDVTYTDAALHANKLSIVFEDIKAARETLDRVREFIKKNPTVYLSTHTPEGVANLEGKVIMKLD
ncbi:MAG: MBL fold metallo-hydrolase [Synergistaceae bacterium]|nr:MBL fold metallo-hydrolase [Synergistaceae bacterium]MBQ3397773.1 MBL fold metallo-hydrolase [Synergistaceae bacterium]MBQ3758539.1 MBL fold metallo-hydrolase [Synergistaceae bacterium]MBQ4402246.1 MBL fold metallo-hydrolase [Synergistaceae bacterium]MBQ6002711.1 MBL fold metallo-hydrolase [Synergistaceae bacterium]